MYRESFPDLPCWSEASGKKKKATPREEEKAPAQTAPDEDEIIERTLGRVCDVICLANLTDNFGFKIKCSPATLEGYKEVRKSLASLQADDQFNWAQGR